MESAEEENYEEALCCLLVKVSNMEASISLILPEDHVVILLSYCRKRSRTIYYTLLHTHFFLSLSLSLSPTPYFSLSHSFTHALSLSSRLLFFLTLYAKAQLCHFSFLIYLSSTLALLSPLTFYTRILLFFNINSDRGGPGPQGGFRRDDRDRDMHPQGPGHGGQGMRNRGYSSGAFSLFHCSIYFIFLLYIAPHITLHNVVNPEVSWLSVPPMICSNLHISVTCMLVVRIPLLRFTLEMASLIKLFSS